AYVRKKRPALARMQTRGRHLRGIVVEVAATVRPCCAMKYTNRERPPVRGSKSFERLQLVTHRIPVVVVVDQGDVRCRKVRQNVQAGADIDLGNAVEFRFKRRGVESRRGVDNR